MAGTQVLDSSTLGSDPSSVLYYADVRNWNSNSASSSVFVPDAAAHGGEPWSDLLAQGAGVYAHVTPVFNSTRLIVIEYWMLYAYNGVFCYGAGTHDGDITSVVLVYDLLTDKLIRAVFSIHGDTVEAFALSESMAPTMAGLYGADVNGQPVQLDAHEHKIMRHGRYQQGPWWHGPSNATIYFIPDPITQQYDHMAVFLEHATHEPWPNPSGDYDCAPKHGGDDVSVLPLTVPLLDSDDDPFVYFGGKVGDPPGIVRHRAWYYPPLPPPAWPASVPRTDPNPYTQMGPLLWPPSVDELAVGTYWTPYVSEETPPAVCVDSVIRAAACSSDYCDNVSIECLPLDGVLPSEVDKYWTPAVSEEGSNSVTCLDGYAATSLSCGGSNCDSVALECSNVGKVQVSCEWLPQFSEEGLAFGRCPPSKVVAGVKCTGSYCDNISLQCCGLQ